MKHPNK